MTDQVTKNYGFNVNKSLFITFIIRRLNDKNMILLYDIENRFM